MVNASDGLGDELGKALKVRARYVMHLAVVEKLSIDYGCRHPGPELLGAGNDPYTPGHFALGDYGFREGWVSMARADMVDPQVSRGVHRFTASRGLPSGPGGSVLGKNLLLTIVKEHVVSF